jgi:predicted enzyme related to lactoylglutathione lyase
VTQLWGIRGRRSADSVTLQMITSIHTLIYSDDAPATRAFLRDVVGWPWVEDAGSEPGWLIFGTGPSEMGVHPTHSTWEGREYSSPRQHQISLMCDDIEATRAELERKGATFGTPISDEGFGLITMMEVPGADPIMVYQPQHQTAYDL